MEEMGPDGLVTPEAHRAFCEALVQRRLATVDNSGRIVMHATDSWQNEPGTFSRELGPLVAANARRRRDDEMFNTTAG